MLFTKYLFSFELTSALLITAALGAMVLTFAQRRQNATQGQRGTVIQRLRGERISPLPGPGVFATADSVAVPALLPDGSIAPESLSEIIEGTPVDEKPRREPDAHVEPAREAPGPGRLAGDPARESADRGRRRADGDSTRGRGTTSRGCA